MYYYVTKTGLPMFDACRAYGLALILERLGLVIEALEDVVIQDIGSFYLLNGPNIDDISGITSTSVYEDLVTLNNGWCRVLLTVSRQLQVDNLGSTRAKVEKKIGTVREMLGSPMSLVQTFLEPTNCNLLSKARKGYESLPGSMDVCAFKGFREEKLNVYNEGGELNAPKRDWAIALLGGANLIYWNGAGRDQVGVLPVPQSVIISNHREIKQMTESGYVNRVSMNTVAAHYGVKLAEAIRKRRSNQIATTNRYTGLVIQSLTYSKSGSWKAKSGSLFPLEYPMRLVDSDLTQASEIFKLWDTLFNIGNKKGKEQIAITLAELVAQPSLENMESYLRVHLRASLRDEELKYTLYQSDSLKEVMQYVR